jgi:cell division protein FtsQ
VRRSEIFTTWPGRAGLVIGVLVLAAAAAVAATYSPLFRLETIQIAGARHLSQGDVLQLAGIARDTNLAHLDLHAAERSLEQNPRVAEATMTRHLPSTLTIDIVERHAVAVAPTSGRLGAVAADGTVLPGVEPSGLPEIRAAVGSLTHAGRASALSALVAVPNDLRPSVEALVVQLDGSLVVEIANGPMVEYGPAIELAAKGEAMRAIIRWAADHDVELGSLDVAAPAAPTARTRDGAAVEM